MGNDQKLDAQRGDLVQIHKIILTPEQRSQDLPASTKAVPYEAWIKGFLLEDRAKIGSTVRVETFIGREISGTLVEINPIYSHNFGKPRPELFHRGKKGNPNVGTKKAKP